MAGGKKSKVGPSGKRRKAKTGSRSNQGLGHAIMNARKLRGKPKVEQQPSGQMKRYRPITKLEKSENRNPCLTSITEVSDLNEFIETKIRAEEYKRRTEETTLILTHDGGGGGAGGMADESQIESALHTALEQDEIYDYANLPIPWRPRWTKETSPQELHFLEEKNFVEWRRRLAHIRHTRKRRQNESMSSSVVRIGGILDKSTLSSDLDEIGGGGSSGAGGFGSALDNDAGELAVTPFEKNIEVWRQLWRVVERSDLCCVIVDSRNILAYLNRDLIRFITEQTNVNPYCRVAKDYLIIINKADYLTALQRQFWADYLNDASKNTLDFVFFSATAELLRNGHLLSKAAGEASVYRRSEEIKENIQDDENDSENDVDSVGNDNDDDDLPKLTKVSDLKDTHVYNRDELIALFRQRYLCRKRQRIEEVKKAMEKEREEMIERTEQKVAHLRKSFLDTIEEHLIEHSESDDDDHPSDNEESLLINMDDQGLIEEEGCMGASAVDFSALTGLETDTDKKNDDEKQHTKLPHLTQTTKLESSDTISNTGSIFDDIRSVMTEGLTGDSFFRENMDRIVIGMIGYPNVGKSSLINVLLDSKSVAVGATPGKTKHLATLQVSDDIMLCDCPGLVFPNLLSSKSDLVLLGVLNIDTLKDFISPARLMVHRVHPSEFYKAYALRTVDGRLIGQPFEEELQDSKADKVRDHSMMMNNDNDHRDYSQRLKAIRQRKSGGRRSGSSLSSSAMRFGKYGQHELTVAEILDSYCRQKKLFGSGGVPLRNVAARRMLKDFIKGRLVYVHPPPKLTSEDRYAFHNGYHIQPELDDDEEQEDCVVRPTLETSEDSSRKIVTLADFAGRLIEEAEQRAVDQRIKEEEKMKVRKEQEQSEQVDTAAEHGFTDELDLDELGELQARMLAADPFGGRNRKKGVKKTRADRRALKRRMKGNRSFRRDASNFESGSNLVSVTAVPSVRTTYSRTQL